MAEKPAATDKPAAGTEGKDKKPADAAAAAAAVADDKKKPEGEGGEDTQAGAEGDDTAEGGDGGEGDAPDWRAELAGDDEKALAFYKRFSDPAALSRHIMETEKRARQKGVQPPKADATPEDWAKFNTEHFGRAEKIEDVEIAPNIPEGEELSPAEATSLKGITGLLHAAGVFSGPAMKQAQQIFADLAVGARKERDKVVETARGKSQTALKKAWRGDYDANLAMANSYAGMRCRQAGVDPNALATLELADGSQLGDNELYARIMALGGRDHSEDPLMNREEANANTKVELQGQLDAEMKKAAGTPKERKEYDSAEGRQRRAQLRTKIKAMGGSAKGAKGK